MCAAFLTILLQCYNQYNNQQCNNSGRERPAGALAILCAPNSNYFGNSWKSSEEDTRS